MCIHVCLYIYIYVYIYMYIHIYKNSAVTVGEPPQRTTHIYKNISSNKTPGEHSSLPQTSRANPAKWHISDITHIKM